MTEGLDGRHRDKDGTIERRRGDTRIGTLKPTYPVLNRFPDDSMLGEAMQSHGVDSLSELLKKTPRQLEAVNMLRYERVWRITQRRGARL